MIVKYMIVRNLFQIIWCARQVDELKRHFQKLNNSDLFFKVHFMLITLRINFTSSSIAQRILYECTVYDCTHTQVDTTNQFNRQRKSSKYLKIRLAFQPVNWLDKIDFENKRTYLISKQATNKKEIIRPEPNKI